MRFAICNETFADWPLDRAMDFAAACGYRGVEIAPFTLGPDLQSITPAVRRSVRDAAARSGLEIVGLHWLLAKTRGFHLTSPDHATRQRTAKYLCDLAELCRDLGGNIMVLGSPQQRNLQTGVSRDEGTAHFTEIIESCLPALERHDVTLALEPLGPAEGNFLNTAAEARRIIDRLASPGCRLHLDCKAMTTETTPIPQLIAEHADVLAHFHANDPNRQGPGFGTLDFVPIFAALRDVKYSGWVSVEVFDYTPGIERLARQSIEYMQQCLAAPR